MPRPPAPAAAAAAAGRPPTAATPPPFSPYDGAGDDGLVLDDEDEFDSEESDDDDVFAFLPPTTAEQLDERDALGAHQKQNQNQNQAQQPHDPAAHEQELGAHGAAAAAAALQAQYFPTPYSPFAHSPFSHAPSAPSHQHPAPDPAAASTSTLASATTSSISTPADPYAWRPVTARAPTADSRSNLNVNLALDEPPPHSAFDSAYSLPRAQQMQQQQQSYSRPRTATTQRARSPPRSPPSPSTDSQPGTAASGDAYRLRRMTPALTSPAPAPSAPAIGGGNQPHDGHQQGEGHPNDDEGGYHHHHQHRESPQTDDDDAEDRTDLEHEVGEPPDSPGTRVADEDEDEDEDGASETAGEEERGRRKGARKGKGGKGRSSVGYAGELGDVEAGRFAGEAVASGVQLHPRGAGEGQRRMRNVNAQPYYAYAALANAHGGACSFALSFPPSLSLARFLLLVFPRALFFAFSSAFSFSLTSTRY